MYGFSLIFFAPLRLCERIFSVENLPKMPRNGLILAMICTSGLGCTSLGLPVRTAAITAAQPAQNPQVLREQGQLAMREGDSAKAIFLFVQSLSLEEKWPHNRLLTSAAGHLARGQDEAASADLAQFLKAHPEHSNARFCHAELFLRMGKSNLARKQFVELIDRCPDTLAEDEHLLLHCHGRLTEIGEAVNDEYAVHLHRGIGLYLLAISTLPAQDDDPDISNESLLCKAMSELNEARELRQSEARPCWYLYGIYRKLGQPHLAQRWLRAAQQAAPFTHLSPAEQRGLELAGGDLTDRIRAR